MRYRATFKIEVIKHRRPDVKDKSVSFSQSVCYQFDIHISVHRNIIPNYSQQDATVFFYLFIFTDALHVSGGFSAHHQEHVTVHTASGIVNQYCY